METQNNLCLGHKTQGSKFALFGIHGIINWCFLSWSKKEIFISLFFKRSPKIGCFYFWGWENFLEENFSEIFGCLRFCSDAAKCSGFPIANPFHRFMSSLMHFHHYYILRPVTFWMSGNASSTKIQTKNNSWHFQSYVIRFNYDLRLKFSKPSPFITFSIFWCEAVYGVVVFVFWVFSFFLNYRSAFKV